MPRFWTLPSMIYFIFCEYAMNIGVAEIYSFQEKKCPFVSLTDTAFSFLKGPDRVDEHDKFVRYQINTLHVHPI